MAPPGHVSGLVANYDGMVAENNENRKAKKQRHFTPGASETGETPPTASGSETEQRANPQDAPPTYAESVDPNTEQQVDSGGAATHDNKIQYGDNLEEDEDSDEDSDSGLSGPYDDDESVWSLDEYVDEAEPPSYEDATNVPSEDELVRQVLANQHQHNQVQHALGRLPCPVILPQRRPRNRSRGFVRAYAPVLENVGIDQETFLKFLGNFHKSSQASPWFTVIMISAAISSNAPSAIAMAVSTAVQFAAKASSEVDARHKTNNFLDRMNDELFKPAGCFAFVMKYKTEPEITQAGPGYLGIGAANVDLSTNQIVAKYDRDTATGSVAGLTTRLKQFRMTSDTTRGSDAVPESAPLIFPAVDGELARTGKGKETFQDKARDAGNFLQDYLDRRAQINYVREDSRGSPAIPGEERQMHSRLAGPNHPIHNSGIIGLLSGGQTHPWDRNAQRHAVRYERKAAKRDHKMDRAEARHERRLDKHQRHMERGVRRFERRFGRPPLVGSSSETSNHGYSDSAEYARPHHGRRGPGLIGGLLNTVSAAVMGGDSKTTPGPANGKEVERGVAHDNGQAQDQQIQQDHERAYRGRRAGRRQRPIRGALRKRMTEDVLYLTIVNMPSEQELADARAMLEGE